MIAGIASTGIASTTANTSRFDRGEPGRGAVARDAGADEHPVLERRAQRAAAGRDLRQRVARELRGDHRRPARLVQRHPLQRPQAGERGGLQHRHRHQPGGRERVKVVPGPEEVQEARRDEVQRHPAPTNQNTVRRSRPRGAARPPRARSPARRPHGSRSRARGGRPPGSSTSTVGVEGVSELHPRRVTAAVKARWPPGPGGHRLDWRREGHSRSPGSSKSRPHG